MKEFLEKIAAILEVESVKETEELRAFPQWDSLAVLSVIAMLDANYGVNLRAAELEPAKTAADLWNLVQSKKRT
jgi:acyl carrier protein